jgi:hypothetical protein
LRERHACPRTCIGERHMADATDMRSQQHDKHNLTTLNSLTSQDCAMFKVVPSMHEAQGHIEMIRRDEAFGTPRRTTRPIASSITALEGHDLRQPCQVGQCAHEFLGHSVRTASELRMLQFVRSASVRLGGRRISDGPSVQVHQPGEAAAGAGRPLIEANDLRERIRGSNEEVWRLHGPDERRYCERRAPSRFDRCQIDAEGEARPSRAPQRLRCKAIPPTRSNV